MAAVVSSKKTSCFLKNNYYFRQKGKTGKIDKGANKKKPGRGTFKGHGKKIRRQPTRW